MSDNQFLDKTDFDSYPGFRSALFFNLSSYEHKYETPKKECSDSCLISLEATPVQTPKGADKLNDNFKFCLSKDLMDKLEESSPLKPCNSKNDLFSDSEVCLIKNEDSDENGGEIKGNGKKGYSDFFEFPGNIFQNSNLNGSNGSNGNGYQHKASNDTPSTFPSENESDCKSAIADQKSLRHSNTDEICRKLNFANASINNSEEKGGVGIENINAESYYPNPSRYNVHNIYGSRHSYPNFKNQNKDEIDNNSNGNGIRVINGKSGWICWFCKNFNYESKLLFLIYIYFS